MSLVNRDLSVPLTSQQAKRVESTSPALRNAVLAQRVAQLEENNATNSADITAIESDVSTLQAETASLLPVGQIRVPLIMISNNVWATYAVAPIYGATVTSIKLVTPTVFASALGAVTLTVKKTSSSGNTMLSGATYNLESASANTLNGVSLTSTAADLVLSGSGLVYIAVTSDNADATGPDYASACLIINYTYTLD